jgi:hypothetical protein
MKKVLFSVLVGFLLVLGVHAGSMDPCGGSECDDAQATPINDNNTGTRWGLNVIYTGHNDYGADGVTLADFDGDGDKDVLVPFEEKGQTRIFKNPGASNSSQREAQKDTWTNAKWTFGNEDAGAGDLDMDGDPDIITFDGAGSKISILWNPGGSDAWDESKWDETKLSAGTSDYNQANQAARCPVVADINGDGDNDLVLHGQVWFEAPASGQSNAGNWEAHKITSSVTWPMNVRARDLDNDGDLDLLATSRKDEEALIWIKQTSSGWANPVKIETKGNGSPRFGGYYTNGLGGIDYATGYEDGSGGGNLVLAKATSSSNPVSSSEVRIDFKDMGISDIKSGSDFPKAIAYHDFNKNGDPEIIWVTMSGGQLYHSEVALADVMSASAWENAATKLNVKVDGEFVKSDDLILHDVNEDGYMDILTTEENGWYGVVWLQNPGPEGGTGSGGTPPPEDPDDQDPGAEEGLLNIASMSHNTKNIGGTNLWDGNTSTTEEDAGEKLMQTIIDLGSDHYITKVRVYGNKDGDTGSSKFLVYMRDGSSWDKLGSKSCNDPSWSSFDVGMTGDEIKIKIKEESSGNGTEAAEIEVYGYQL